MGGKNVILNRLSQLVHFDPEGMVFTDHGLEVTAENHKVKLGVDRDFFDQLLLDGYLAQGATANRYVWNTTPRNNISRRIITGNSNQITQQTYSLIEKYVTAVGGKTTVIVNRLDKRELEYYLEVPYDSWRKVEKFMENINELLWYVEVNKRFGEEK